MDIDAYRLQAETFIGDLNLAYYRHFAGLDREYAVEAVYDRHATLFTPDAVEELRTRAANGTAAGGDAQRRSRALMAFAVEGHLGIQTRAIDAQLARLEASLTLPFGSTSTPIGFRESAAIQANEPDPSRRAEIEAARLAVTASELNPLALQALESTHAVAKVLGWSSYVAMCEECQAIDLGGLQRQTEEFVAATDERYYEIVDQPLRRATGVGLDDIGRCDLPRFFRGAEFDVHFPSQTLVTSFQATMAALEIDTSSACGITIDVTSRPAKSPRAFCAPVRVPGEIYLVVAPLGGRDDYCALLHEAGHAQHYAHVDPTLAFEFRCLGDNSVTEAFAFLFDRLIEEPGWLSQHLGVDGRGGALAAHARAERLIYLRRYSAKLAYELKLHSSQTTPLSDLSDEYAQQLTRALRIDWPSESWLTDVDPCFYAANYLRAWALETQLRSMLIEQFGERWYSEPGAAEVLRELWRDGQRLNAQELCQQICGAPLDFAAVLSEFE